LRKIQASIAQACLFSFLLLVASLRIALIEIYWRIAATHRYNIRSALAENLILREMTKCFW
jgi:hypothetical protein